MSSTRARWGRSKERTEQNTRPMGWYQNPIILVHPDRAGIKPTRHSDFPVRRAGRPTAMRNITAFPAASGEKKSVTSSSRKVSPVAPHPRAYAARYVCPYMSEWRHSREPGISIEIRGFGMATFVGNLASASRSGDDEHHSRKDEIWVVADQEAVSFRDAWPVIAVGVKKRGDGG